MKKPGPILAFDRGSVRSYDADGRLHVALTNISKANVNKYYGSEIPGFAQLGLDPARIYSLWRDPAELEKAVASFANMPLQLKHVHQKASDPQQDLIVGSVGSPIFEFPYLKASLCVWHEEGIAVIETEAMVELSSSYHYTADMTPGTTPEGEPYDGRMTNIAGNHVALVEEGRAGPDVVVADSKPLPPKQETPAMKLTKLGLALKLALSAASPKIAQDSSLGALVGQAKAKTFKKEEVKAKLLAMDSDMDAENLDALIDSLIGVEENPEPETPPLDTLAGDTDGAAGVIEFLKGKGLSPEDLDAVSGMLSKLAAPAATDEDPEAMTQKDVDTAMDSLSKKLTSELTKKFQDLEVAKSAVRGTVGDVIGMDSAAGVYRFALDHLKVDHKETPDTGLGNLFKVASALGDKPAPVNTIAADAAIALAIPGLARFS
jgi:hypothetical protein